MRVNEYNNLEEVDNVKREIIDLYEEDFVICRIRQCAF